jgi:hypothetical protein
MTRIVALARRRDPRDGRAVDEVRGDELVDPVDVALVL